MKDGASHRTALEAGKEQSDAMERESTSIPLSELQKAHLQYLADSIERYQIDV